MNFVVLSSSRGTTFQSVLDAIANGSLTAKCLGLITDKDDRECILKAETAFIPYKVVKKVKGEEREKFDKRVHEAIQELHKESAAPEQHTVLAEMGWMWIHTPWFIQKWKNQIVNVHPALLPKYGGKGMYGKHVHAAALENNESESGMTIHVMDEGVDTGKILLQKSCTIESDETIESLQKKVQDLEKEWYPKALQMLENGQLTMED